MIESRFFRKWLRFSYDMIINYYFTQIMILTIINTNEGNPVCEACKEMQQNMATENVFTI